MRAQTNEAKSKRSRKDVDPMRAARGFDTTFIDDLTNQDTHTHTNDNTETHTHTIERFTARIAYLNICFT